MELVTVRDLSIKHVYTTQFIYCRSGNIREGLIFGIFARKTNLRNQESRENYFYISASKEK